MEGVPTNDRVATDFVELVRHEPRLGRLLSLCRSASPPSAANDLDEIDDAPVDDVPWCFEDFFFQAIKPQLLDLVGWGRAHGPPILKSTRAYDVAYWTLHAALPWTCECCRNA